MPPCRYYRNQAGQLVDSFTIVRQSCDSGAYNGWYDYSSNSCGMGARPACWMLQAATGMNTWKEWGGCYPRHRRERMMVAFADGHVKPYRPTQLAQGCDARPSCGGFILDPSQYLWDLDDY